MPQTLGSGRKQVLGIVLRTPSSWKDHKGWDERSHERRARSNELSKDYAVAECATKRQILLKRPLKRLQGAMVRKSSACASTVSLALAQATPEIWTSDQGSHFTSAQYRA